MPIRKAVIPAAGFGTRMLPAVKAVPKEMLPVLDKPVVQYVIEEAAAAGLTDALLIVSRGKSAIEDHFDRYPDLEARLLSTGRQSLLASLGEISRQIKIHSVRQPEQRGLGDAVLQAKQHVGDEPFLCQLGDTIFSGESPAQQLVDAYKKFGTSVIGLEEVPAEKVSRYGIVGGAKIADDVLKLDALVEKPSIDNAPSRYAIAARYVLSPMIFQCLAETTPGKNGEIQLTDAMRLLLSREPIHGVILRGARHDVGNPTDWLKTNLLFASRDAAMWSALEPTIRALLARS